MSAHVSDDAQLARVFFPYAQERTAKVQARGSRFVYYTSADTAYRILLNREVWLRNALLMNDFREIDHGVDCLETAFQGSCGALLNETLEDCFPGLGNEVVEIFRNLLPVIRSDTYIACLSEHCSEEDQRGRLSMWRAYGGTTGVALVINGAVMHSASDALGVYSSPVFYANENQFADSFMRVVKGISKARPLLKRVGKDRVQSALLQMFRFAVLCTKHPGFDEELEWRVISSPSLRFTGHLASELEVVRGVPQRVLKVRLQDIPEEGLTGLRLPALVDRVIIGPCAFPEVTAMSF